MCFSITINLQMTTNANWYNKRFKNEKAQLMQRECVTVMHVWRPIANQSKLTDNSNRHSTRWW